MPDNTYSVYKMCEYVCDVRELSEKITELINKDESLKLHFNYHITKKHTFHQWINFRWQLFKIKLKNWKQNSNINTLKW